VEGSDSMTGLAEVDPRSLTAGQSDRPDGLISAQGSRGPVGGTSRTTTEQTISFLTEAGEVIPIVETREISAYWQSRALEFHVANPHVYEALVRYARQARAAGVDRIGIELLWNRMRWDWMLETEHAHDYKLNQNYKAWYARRIMELESDLAGIFETRSRRAAA
jgi:hypothetical protein